MKKMFIIILLIFSNTLYGWHSYYYQYSDFGWMDNKTLLVKRQELLPAASIVITDIIRVDVDSKWITSLTPSIDGHCLNEIEKIIYTYTNKEIILFDFSEDHDNPVMKTVFNLNSDSLDKIIRIEWVSGSILMIYTFNSHEYRKIIYDYSNNKIQEIMLLPQVPTFAFYMKLNNTAVFYSEDFYFIQISINSVLSNALNNHAAIVEEGYPCLIVTNRDSNYTVLAGPFYDDEIAFSIQKILDKKGWKGNFIRKRELSNIEGTDYWFNDSNIWIMDRKEFTPLLKGGVFIEPVTIIGSRLIFLKSSSLWSYDLDKKNLKRLSLSGLDYSSSCFYDGSSLNFTWNEKEGGIFFDLSQNGEKTYWFLPSVKGGLFQINEPIAINSNNYTLINLNKYITNKNNIDNRPLDGVYALEIDDNNKSLLIEFYQNMSGDWCNGVSLIEDSKKNELLPPLSNWR